MYLLIFTLKTWQIDITPFPTNPRGKAKEIAEDSIIYIYKSSCSKVWNVDSCFFGWISEVFGSPMDFWYLIIKHWYLYLDTHLYSCFQELRSFLLVSCCQSSTWAPSNRPPWTGWHGKIFPHSNSKIVGSEKPLLSEHKRIGEFNCDLVIPGLCLYLYWYVTYIFLWLGIYICLYLPWSLCNNFEEQ